MSIRFDEISARLKELEPRLRAEFQVRSLHVFGSVARGEAGPSSDLDVLVEFDGQHKFAQFMDLKFLIARNLRAAR